MTRAVFAAVGLGLALALSGAPDLPQPAQARSPTQAGCRMTTPGPGTPVRAGILNALRPQVEQMAGQDVEFVVDQIRVACNWARVVANPRAPGGHGNHYEPVDALLQRSGTAWRVRLTACGEVDCPSAAQQYRQAYPNLPRGLLF
jgi:hypothetical protein